MNNTIPPLNINTNVQKTFDLNRAQSNFSRVYDDFMYERTLSPLKKQIKNTTNELWQEMKMPKELCPLIIFDLNPRHGLGAADPTTAILSFPKVDSALKMVMMMGGGEKCVLRHELQHIKQMYSVARLVGVDALAEMLQSKGLTLDKYHYENVIESLGRIPENSPEEKYAKKCYNAIKNYVDPTITELKIEEHKNSILTTRLKYKAELFIDKIKYHRNFLEKDANSMAKPFEEYSLNLFKALKIALVKKLPKIIK